MGHNGELWLARSHPGGIEIPIAPREIAQLYTSIGWEVRPLRPKDLGEQGVPHLRRYLDDLARAERARPRPGVLAAIVIGFELVEV